jgi:hypothetical protein
MANFKMNRTTYRQTSDFLDIPCIFGMLLHGFEQGRNELRLASLSTRKLSSGVHKHYSVVAGIWQEPCPCCGGGAQQCLRLAQCHRETGRDLQKDSSRSRGSFNVSLKSIRYHCVGHGLGQSVSLNVWKQKMKKTDTSFEVEVLELGPEEPLASTMAILPEG